MNAYMLLQPTSVHSCLSVCFQISKTNLQNDQLSYAAFNSESKISGSKGKVIRRSNYLCM